MKRVDNRSNLDIDEMLKNSVKRRLLDRNKIIEEILQRDVEYRHGVKAIKVSDIAQQYFCEAKVENKYIRGEIETEEKKEGKEIHELMLTAEEEELELEKLAEEIATNPWKEVVGLLLISKIDGCYVIGEPDLVVFSYGEPEFIIEIKTTSRCLRIWNNEVVQARMYGLLLHSMRFDTKGLTLIVVKIRRGVDRDLLNEIQQRIFKHVNDLIYTLKSEEDIKKEDDLYGEVYSFRMYPFDLQKAYDEFKWAKDYWLNKRKEPKPTTKSNKCKSCEYRDVCKYSLTKNLNT